ncbi:MAG: G1 family glutamic endopeptidase [Solirubrobacteraceae bacterium]|jgi:hypothetical protein
MRSGLIALLALVLIPSVLAVSAYGATPSPWAFGSFAGYVWRGHVTSVQASWTVPEIASNTSGLSGTWIGAQAPGSPGAFIQIGVNEARLRPFALGARFTQDYAFWSDVANHFHAHLLFPVYPGDRISASLMLAHRQWMLTIVDKTSRATAHFATRDEASASFNQAEWLQEDPRNGFTHKPALYPRLSAIRFRRLYINSVMPAYRDLYSQWMSANGVNFGPSPLRQDAFTLGPATVSPIGARYLHIAAAEDAATGAFAAQLSGWTATTPKEQIASANSTFATALNADIHALTRVHWPAAVRPRIHSLIHSTRVLLKHLQSLPSASSGGLRVWTSVEESDGSAIGRAGHMVRRALKIPEYSPTI